MADTRDKAHLSGGEKADIAEACLNYLIANPEELARFMQTQGYSPDGLRARLGSPELENGLLDYFVHNESLLLAMSANSSVAPDRVTALWRRLNETDD